MTLWQLLEAFRNLAFGEGLSEHYGYDKHLHNVIRNRLVLGGKNATLHTRFPEIPDPYLETALTIALAMKEATKSAGPFCPSNSAETGVFPTRKMVAGQVAVRYRCCDAQLTFQYVYLKTKCNYCHKRGHLAKVCRSRKSPNELLPRGKGPDPASQHVRNKTSQGQTSAEIRAIAEDNVVSKMV